MKDLYEAMGGKHLSTWLVQVAVWAIIILALPMATWLSTQDTEAAKTSFKVVFDLLLSPFLIYFANFFVFGPLLFSIDEKEARTFRLYNKLSNRTRYLIFALCNLIAIPLFNSKFFMIWWHRNSIPDMPEMTTNMWIGFFSRTDQAHGSRTRLAEKPDQPALPLQHVEQYFQPDADRS